MNTLELLQHSPDTASLLFEEMPGYIYFVKEVETMTIISLNNQMAEIIGLPIEKIIGKKDTELFPPPIAEACMQDDLVVISSGKPLRNKVELIPNKHGLVEWTITTKVPVFDKQGKVIAIAGVTRPFSASAAGMEQISLIDAAVDTMKNNFTDKLSIPELAKQVNLSVSAFERSFKKIFNMTATQYIRHLRVQHGCFLLSSSNDSIAQIAFECGYCDQSHFHRDFSRIMHSPPSSYRKNYKLHTETPK